jgi:hypothetical protein
MTALDWEAVLAWRVERHGLVARTPSLRWAPGDAIRLRRPA